MEGEEEGKRERVVSRGRRRRRAEGRKRLYGVVQRSGVENNEITESACPINFGSSVPCGNVSIQPASFGTSNSKGLLGSLVSSMSVNVKS